MAHDGTWGAHPALVPVAREASEEVLGAREDQRAVVHADRSTAMLLKLFVRVATDAGRFVPFLALPAYERLVAAESSPRSLERIRRNRNREHPRASTAHGQRERRARPMEWHHATISPSGRDATRRLAAHRAPARDPRREQALEPAQRRALHPGAGRDHRQPGDATSQGRPTRRIRGRLAARRGHQRRGRGVSRPEPLPLEQRADAGASNPARARARGPHRALEGRRAPRLVCAARRGRRGRLRGSRSARST